MSIDVDFFHYSCLVDETKDPKYLNTPHFSDKAAKNLTFDKLSPKFTFIKSGKINLNFMKTYIAILKGINVGGHKKIMMADLRKMLCEISYIGEVNTYIQSGNIIFNTDKKIEL